MKIYVAGKWEEKERVQEVQNLLRRYGHTITWDWTNEPPLTKEKGKAYYAAKDKEGVLNADAFVGVFEKDLPYKGAFCEMGIAIGKGIPIYILGLAADANIFVELPEVHRGLEGLIGEYSDAVSN